MLFKDYFYGKFDWGPLYRAVSAGLFFQNAIVLGEECFLGVLEYHYTHNSDSYHQVMVHKGLGTINKIVLGPYNREKQEAIMYTARDLGLIEELKIVGSRPDLKQIGLKSEVRDFYQLKGRGDIKDIVFVQGEVPYFALAVWEEPEDYCIFASA